MKFSVKQKLLSLITILLIALIFAGCARKSANGTSGDKKVIGFSQMENNGPWRIAETKSMRDEAGKLGGDRRVHPGILHSDLVPRNATIKPGTNRAGLPDCRMYLPASRATDPRSV